MTPGNRQLFCVKSLTGSFTVLYQIGWKHAIIYRQMNGGQEGEDRWHLKKQKHIWNRQDLQTGS